MKVIDTRIEPNWKLSIYIEKDTFPEGIYLEGESGQSPWEETGSRSKEFTHTYIADIPKTTKATKHSDSYIANIKYTLTSESEPTP